MGLTIAQANAISRVVYYLAGLERKNGGRPSADEAAEALALLTEAATKTLMAGAGPADARAGITAVAKLRTMLGIREDLAALDGPRRVIRVKARLVGGHIKAQVFAGQASGPGLAGELTLRPDELDDLNDALMYGRSQSRVDTGVTYTNEAYAAVVATRKAGGRS